MPEPFPSKILGSKPPGLRVWAEWEDFLLGRDAEIAAHLRLPVRVITFTRENHLVTWEWWEYRLHTDTPDQAGRLTAQERSRVREIARLERKQQVEVCLELLTAAGQEYTAKQARQGEAGAREAKTQQEIAALFGPASAQQPESLSRWQQIRLSVLDFFRRITGAALVLIAAFLLGRLIVERLLP